MLRRILVPLDGSPRSERALTYAEGLARRSDARLILARAATAHDLSRGDPLTAHIKALARVEEYLRDTARALNRRGFNVTTAAHYGDPANWIVEVARAKWVDLIVMASRGRGGVSDAPYGRVAGAVLARSQVPVLLVRAHAGERDPAWPPPRLRVVVGLDGSAFAERALPAARSLAHSIGGELVLVRAVVPPDAECGPRAFDGHRLRRELEVRVGEAGRHLAQQVRPIASDGDRVWGEVRVGTPARVIADAASDRDAALVVLSGSVHAGFDRPLLGRVVGEVLHASTTPLLLVGPLARWAGPAERTAPATVPDPGAAPRVPGSQPAVVGG